MIRNINEAIVSSIVDNRAMTISDSWTILAYIGDTSYHAHIYYDGEEKSNFSDKDLDAICREASRWFNKETVTTLPAGAARGV